MKNDQMKKMNDLNQLLSKNDSFCSQFLYGSILCRRTLDKTIYKTDSYAKEIIQMA